MTSHMVCAQNREKDGIFLCVSTVISHILTLFVYASTEGIINVLSRFYLISIYIVTFSVSFSDYLPFHFWSLLNLFDEPTVFGKKRYWRLHSRVWWFGDKTKKSNNREGNKLHSNIQVLKFNNLTSKCYILFSVNIFKRDGKVHW